MEEPFYINKRKRVMNVKSIWEEKCVLSPSLICLDMLHLEENIRQLERAGVRMLHVDILDGHFSPSMPLGFETVKQLRRATDMAFECHVMGDPPEYFVDELLQIGVEQITFQIETAPHVDGLLNTIHNAGVLAGVALKPATPLSALDYVLDKCDSVLVMQINPGYASHKGENRVAYADRKVRELRRMIDEHGSNAKIILDGRVSLENIEAFGGGTADIFVGGTTCVSVRDIPGSIARFNALRERLLGAQ